MTVNQIIREIYEMKQKGMCDNYWECLLMILKYQDLTIEELAELVRSDKVFVSRLENDLKELNLLKHKGHSKKVKI